MQKYEIDIKTGDEMGAGTDSKAKLAMIGSDKTIEIEMDPKDALNNSSNLLEKGQVDSFVIYAKPLGVMNKISIGNDGKGMGADWLLEYVKISYKTETFRYVFQKCAILV
jgi:hypothetical protein